MGINKQQPEFKAFPDGECYVPERHNKKKFFAKIWETREHVSEVSGTPLGDEPIAHFFSHLLPVGKYKRWEFKEENVFLMTADEHYSWEFQGMEQAIGKYPGLARFYPLKEEYRIEYEAEYRNEK